MRNATGRFVPIPVHQMRNARVQPRDVRIMEIKPLLDELRTGLGFRVSDRFYQSLLRSIGE